MIKKQNKTKKQKKQGVGDRKKQKENRGGDDKNRRRKRNTKKRLPGNDKRKRSRYEHCVEASPREARAVYAHVFGISNY